MHRAVFLARYTGQRQPDVLRMTQETSKTAGSSSCSRKPERSCGCPYTPILGVRSRAAAARPTC
jgi:hypothetical protein